MKKCFWLILMAILLSDCTQLKIESIQAFSQVLMQALFMLFAFTALVLGCLGLVLLFRVVGLLFRSSRYLFVDDDEGETVLSWQKPETPNLYRQMDADQARLFSELLSSNHDDTGIHDSSGIDFIE